VELIRNVGQVEEVGSWIVRVVARVAVRVAVGRGDIVVGPGGGNEPVGAALATGAVLALRIQEGFWIVSK